MSASESRMTVTKRAVDLTCALLGLLILSPLLGIVALAVFLEDRHGPIFRQQRIGQGGKPFLIWKFRSMRPEAGALVPKVTIGRDPRVTRVGRLLRASKIDELPQLLNVLRGEMSLVGPRPEVPFYVNQYTNEQRAVLALRPGITDPASVRYRDEAAVLDAYDDPDRAYMEIVMPDKIRINLQYSAHATLWSDIGVILATIGIGTIVAEELVIPSNTQPYRRIVH